MASLAELAAFLRSLKGRTLITYHTLADADSVCSAFVLQALLPGRPEVRSTGGLSAHARHVLQRLGLKEPPALTGLKYDNVILVDVSTPALLEEWAVPVQKFKGKKVIIDHHLHKSPMRAHCYYNDPSQPSTGEIIYRLCQLTGHSPKEKEALLLLTSMLRDTAMFKSANAFTFDAVSALLHRTKWTFQQVRALAEARPDISERIACLKAGQRVAIYRADELLFATSMVSSFELAAAASLVEAGADAAFVGNERLGRLSGVKRETLQGVNVARIMEQAGAALGGSGGGHENVGGAQGSVGKLAMVLEGCVRIAVAQAGASGLKRL